MVRAVEFTNVRRCSSETNKLGYVHSIRGTIFVCSVCRRVIITECH